ncbi:GNAT superfamily N-acetyltransferase [Agromyces terreus]|uniref:GNAT superfamily N-acetyltransferase n=1 Tax=Agromyces terreus TaxID=424795 RepID=A0A9X2KDM7_9MICO|nr:GNAT family N-acetyltransferase [Agromyces terreus]MCP2369732.1 GNAT superfamily N-acetyltransferase [Agromyces terreus]
MLHALDLPVDLDTRIGGVVLRRARPGDLGALMRLLSDDPISASRGDVAASDDEPAYRRALEEILGDPANDLLVAVVGVGVGAGASTSDRDGDGRLVGTLQLTRIPGMARRGSTRLLVEAVRVRSDLRSSGIGGAMMRWVTDVAAPALGSSLVQLTSDAARVDAHRFYERLGFAASHTGFKYRVR